MSVPSRLKRSFPLGGTAHSAKGAPVSVPSRLKCSFPLGGAVAQRQEGTPVSRTSRLSRAWRPLSAALGLALVLWAAPRPAQADRRFPGEPPEAQEPAPPEAAALPAQAPLDKQIDMIRKILPQAKRVGLIYDPGEPVSVAAVKQVLDLLSKAGMNPVEITVPHEWDVGPAARNLISRVDLIYTVFDKNVAAQYPILVQTCDQGHIPLFTADPGQVRLGAAAALGLPGMVKPQAPAVRRAAGRSARRARAERPVAGDRFYLNLGAAARQGVTVPDEVLKSAVLVSQIRSSPRKADGVKP